MDASQVVYPVLLICGLLALMLVVGTSATYLGLRVVGARFGTCPNCGRRGAGRIVENEVIDSRSHMDFKSRTPKRVTVKTFEDHWQCQHCGHEWTKTARETERKAVKSSKRV